MRGGTANVEAITSPSSWVRACSGEETGRTTAWRGSPFRGVLLPASAQAGEVVFSPQNSPPNANDGWQAGTCNTPSCAPEQSGGSSSSKPPRGHPPFGITQFIVRHQTVLAHEVPEVNMKTLRVDLPVGLSVNPGATPQCEAAHPKECPSNTTGRRKHRHRLARTAARAAGADHGPGLQPRAKQGQPARFGFTVEAVPALPVLPPSDIYLEADVAYESDFHEGFTINVPKVARGEIAEKQTHLQRPRPLPIRGSATSSPPPSTCLDPNQAAFQHTYSTYARADSLRTPTPPSPTARPSSSRSCPRHQPESLRLDPVQTVGRSRPRHQPGRLARGRGHRAETAGRSERDGQETSTMRTARVTLPQGMGINPSARQRPRPPAPTPSSARGPATPSPARQPRRSAR